MGCASLLIKPCLETNQTQTRPNKSKPSINVSELVTHLLLVLRVKCFPFRFYANRTGRHKMISSGWTVRKEVGSSDSSLGCKNRPRRNRFFGVLEALKLVCHYASYADLGSEMTMFSDQIRPYCGVNTRAPEYAAKTAMLIIHRAGRILTECNSLDAKQVRTQVKSIVFKSHFHTPCTRGGRKGGLRRGEIVFSLETWNLEDRGGFFFCLHFLISGERENYPAVNRWVW